MAFFHIKNIQIKGISVAVPATNVSNFGLDGYDPEELKKIIATLGIENRRVASPGQCASDLCMAAAEKLIVELQWDKSDIEVLFFVTQTPDYYLPGTSMYIQDKLGLSDSCVTFDLNQGCAGYVYGLSLITGFMSASGLKKGLLLVGDTISKLISPLDKSLAPIFADCGSATALEFNSDATDMMFNLTVDGRNFEAIIIPEGGSRHPLDESSFTYTEHEGNIKRKGFHLAMKGLEVLNFSLKKVAQNVEEILQKSNQPKKAIDYFVFHQANRLILDSIMKKLHLDHENVPSSLKDYGNTSSATIPLTITNSLRNEKKVVDAKMLLSGFGVGLSLASAIVDFKNVVCLPILEL